VARAADGVPIPRSRPRPAAQRTSQAPVAPTPPKVAAPTPPKAPATVPPKPPIAAKPAPKPNDTPAR
jgi:hypothetical protein